MKTTNSQTGNLYLITALIMLLAGLCFGVMAAHAYIIPGFWKDALGFVSLRPMHVSSVMFWILLGATGSVYTALKELSGSKGPNHLAFIQWLLWIIAIFGIFHSYGNYQFGGREYWEFNPVFALPIAAAWLLFIFNFTSVARKIKNWPVYIWMWMTGIVFFMFTFIENYLWVFPYFRDHFINDTTIQWKANGSLVGCWNQIIYGTAFYLMDRISKGTTVGHSKVAFGMYFLGLFNLMFNWGHHVYTLPTDSYVQYIGYGVSMTEWIFFARIIFSWKKTITTIQKNYHYFPYRFLMVADVWVFINMGQAILMSIPAINLYTHGTHVTVAHAMGTTIGINTMILLATCFEFLGDRCISFQRENRWVNISFWGTQISLVIFWASLNIIGIKKGIWQMSEHQLPFSMMMDNMQGWFRVFVYSGSVMMITIGAMVIILISAHITCAVRKKKEKANVFKVKLIPFS